MKLQNIIREEDTTSSGTISGTTSTGRIARHDQGYQKKQRKERRLRKRPFYKRLFFKNNKENKG